jgi:hypothetical protein
MASGTTVTAAAAATSGINVGDILIVFMDGATLATDGEESATVVEGWIADFEADKIPTPTAAQLALVKKDIADSKTFLAAVKALNIPGISSL